MQNPHAAGIDVHTDNPVVCFGPGQVRTFGAYSADWHAIAEALRQAAITTVAMASTGVYWIRWFEHSSQKLQKITPFSRFFLSTVWIR